MRRLFPAAAEEPRVPLAPLIDVIFLVLVAFIEATLFLTTASGVPIALPAAASAERAADGDAIAMVAITREGGVFLDDRAISLAALENELAARLTAAPQLAVHVRADRDARVEPLVAVLDRIRRAGIGSLVIAAEGETGIDRKTVP